MVRFKNSQIFFDYDKCQQCGGCIAVCPANAISFERLKNGLADIIVDHDKCIRCQRCVKICPANKDQSFENYFSGIENKKYFLGRNSDFDFSRKSSSGGVCKTLIIESLRSGRVDGVYTLVKTDGYPGAEGEFYTTDNIPDAERLPNSIYHSVMQCKEIAKVKKCKRLMIVGTSCQLRALESALRGKYEKLIKICIFCKQQKTLDSTRFLAKICGATFPPVADFKVTYRGDGWPGVVKVMDKTLPWHRAAQIPFGRRLWTVPGCKLCGDPFGFLAGADISLMDPWLIRQHNDIGETLIISNTPNGQDILMNTDCLSLTPMDYQTSTKALGITDIKRKQALVPYFAGKQTTKKVALAAKADIIQKKLLASFVSIMPKMPMIFYRLLCKLPDFRNLILGKL